MIRHLSIICRIVVIVLCGIACFMGSLAEDIDFVWAPYNGFMLFEVNGKLGLMTDTGEIVVPAEYDNLILKGNYKPFDNYLGQYDFGLAEKDGKYAILDSNNRLTTDNTFDIFWKDDSYADCFPKRMDNGVYIGFYEENGKYGIFNTLGERVTEPIFDLDAFADWPATGFVNGTAPVHMEDGWGIMNAKGEIVSDERWKYVWSLPNGYCVVQLGEREGLVSPEGKTILEVEFMDIVEYGEGLVYVYQFREYGNLHGYVNMEGELVIPFGEGMYAGQAFLNGLAVAYAKGGCGMINRLGEFVIAPAWDRIDRKPNYENEEYLQIMKDGLYGVMDINGKLISEPQWDEIAFTVERESYYRSRQPDEGPYPIEYFRVRKGDVWGLLDLDGNVLSQPQWWNIDVFINGAAVVITPERKYGAIDRDGRLIGEAFWDDCDKFNDGFALVRKTDYDDEETGYTFLSPNGAVLDQEWEGAYSFSDGVARVQENGLWGLINTEGGLIVPYQYDDAGRYDAGIEPSREGMSRVRKDGLYGFVNTKGELVIPCQFVSASNFAEGVCVVSNEDGLKGYIDTSGTIVVPFQFDYACTFEDGLAEVGKSGVDGLMTRDFQMISGIKEPVILPDESGS